MFYEKATLNKLLLLQSRSTNWSDQAQNRPEKTFIFLFQNNETELKQKKQMSGNKTGLLYLIAITTILQNLKEERDIIWIPLQYYKNTVCHLHNPFNV